MSDLFDFLTNLATNPRGQEAFTRDPQAVMEAAGLAETDQAVLKSGDRATVAEFFADEDFEPSFIAREPNPDPSPDPDADSDSSEED